jgi:hypothetical protein
MLMLAAMVIVCWGMLVVLAMVSQAVDVNGRRRGRMWR